MDIDFDDVLLIGGNNKFVPQPPPKRKRWKVVHCTMNAFATGNQAYCGFCSDNKSRFSTSVDEVTCLQCLKKMAERDEDNMTLWINKRLNAVRKEREAKYGHTQY